MTVVVIDPRRPDVIPLAARPVLAGTVLVTEDVPASVLWELDAFEPAVVDSDPALTLLTTDPAHSLVRARITQGDRVIQASTASGSELLDAVALMDTLRRNGPWESTQTHASLRRYLLEEVYELLDAIDGDDQENLREELGDLLLQVLFHARIAADDPVAPFISTTSPAASPKRCAGVPLASCPASTPTSRRRSASGRSARPRRSSEVRCSTASRRLHPPSR